MIIVTPHEAEMLSEEKAIKVLVNYFKKNKIATMHKLMQLLKTTNRMSVYRRLRNLDYISSFSAAGKYYTLKNIPSFDAVGLWIFNTVGFSRCGNLKTTLIYFIEESDVGVTHHELKAKLKINLREALHHALLSLVELRKVSRVTLNENIYLYTSENKTRAKTQISNRGKINVSFKEFELPDYIIIEVLASTIRTSQTINIDYLKIVSELKEKKIMLTEEQVAHVLNKFDLKKTPEYP